MHELHVSHIEITEINSRWFMARINQGISAAFFDYTRKEVYLKARDHINEINSAHYSANELEASNAK